MNGLLKICFILWLINGAEGEAKSCVYRYKLYSTTGYKNKNISYYSCDLDFGQANYNEKLTRIEGRHLTGHTDADVKLIDNYLDDVQKTFSSIVCQKFPNLEVIRTTDSTLESIDENSLYNCKYLIDLHLYGNQIREFPEQLFLNQKELEELWLGENPIGLLPSNIFRPLVKLAVLFLDYNKFQSINPEWFANLQNLMHLDLSENQISEIPSKCFASLRKLKILRLNGNGIKIMNPDSFVGLLNLQKLSMNRNEISDLPAGVFGPLKNLQELNLNNNKLTKIHSDFFGIHNKLINIDLGNNKLNAIDPKLIDNTAVSNLHMTNNICSQSNSYRRMEINNILRICFANYQPRPVQTSSTCGRSILPQGNIIGGTQIKLGSYPWIAALLRPTGKFFCGGTLVSNRKVVTVAHCIKPKGHTIPLLSNQLSVLLGFFNLDISFETGRVNLLVHSIHIHPDWNSLTYSHDADIAVLLLENQVQFNPHIQPICMTSTDPRIVAMSEGVVVGNGRGSKDNEYESIPKFLKMPIQADEICMEKDTFFKVLSSGRTFCAGSADGSGVCTGDSGSGFVVKIGNAYYLRGIVSVSLGDPMLGCDVNSFAIFTDAVKFVNWINGIPFIDEDRYIFSDK